MIPEMLADENKKQYAAFGDYCRMGAGRSLALLVERYQAAAKPLPPTRRLNTLKEWSRRFKWQARVAVYDKAVQDEADATAKAHRAAIMAQGYALDYKRVEALNKLADLLLDEVYTEDKRWVPDVKQIGAGPYAERVDLVRFNASLIDQYRGVLDDIAKEVGDRKTRQEVTGKDGGPIQHEDVGLTDERRADRVITLLDAARARRDGRAPGGGGSPDMEAVAE